MESVIFIGANSDIAQATIDLWTDTQSLILLTRDTSKLPTDVQKQYDCYRCNPCQIEEECEQLQFPLKHT